MPYVITNTTPAMSDTVTPGQPWPRSTTRRVVATLDEARREVFNRVTDVVGYTAAIGFPTNVSVTDKISEAGGTIGPLPDGTVIEVERLSS